MNVDLPAHGWRPRPYQMPAWTYLENGGLHAELLWARRHGKDDVSLHRTAIAAMERPGNYWHMLPLATQVRKAIWTAVNPHTGRRRIDEVFPHALRRATREQEMQLEFVNGSTWQALGSDNFQSSIGSSPCGIVYSEWAQSDPASRGYLRPILLENNGWQIYISTPRGNNHAKKTFDSAKRDPDAFAELLTADDTGVFTPAQLAKELQAYIDDYGVDFGTALFQQEYYCSFSAAIIGAYYGAEISKLEREGRLGLVPHNPAYLVHTAWDLGYTDDTAIWFYQIIGTRVCLIDYYFASGVGIAHYAGQCIGREVELHLSTHRVRAEYGADIPEAAHRKVYRYGKHHLPHDARGRRIESAGRTCEDQLAAVLGAANIRVLPIESLETGIQAVRAMLPYVWADAERCAEGVEALRQYQREWDEERKVFSKRPLHNWCFTGETCVWTRDGWYQMMNLPTTGEVLTLCGWRPYTNPRITRINAPLVEVVFTSGCTVRCTPDHLFMTVNGWRSASDLQRGTQIQSTWTLLRGISTAVCTAFGRKKPTTQGAAKVCIAPRGPVRLARFLLRVTSTIATAIRPTTNWRTSNASPPSSTWRRRGERIGRALLSTFQRMRALVPLLGTDPMPAGCGIAGMRSETRSGPSGSVSHARVSGAARPSIVYSALTAGRRSIAATIARPLFIESVKPLNERADVWCLTVPDGEHFSLANGAVVHNCSHPADSVRYLALAWQSERAIEPPKPVGVTPFTEAWLMSGDEDLKPKTRWK